MGTPDSKSPTSNLEESSQGEQREFETQERDFRNSSTWFSPAPQVELPKKQDSFDASLESEATRAAGLWSQDYESLTPSQFQEQMMARHRPRPIKEDNCASLLMAFRNGYAEKSSRRKSPLLTAEEQAKLVKFRRFLEGIPARVVVDFALALRRADAATSTYDEDGVAWQKARR